MCLQYLHALHWTAEHGVAGGWSENLFMDRRCEQVKWREHVLLWRALWFARQQLRRRNRAKTRRMLPTELSRVGASRHSCVPECVAGSHDLHVRRAAGLLNAVTSWARHCARGLQASPWRRPPLLLQHAQYSPSSPAVVLGNHLEITQARRLTPPQSMSMNPYCKHT